MSPPCTTATDHDLWLGEPAAGIPFEVGSNHPFLLLGDRLWRVHAGWIDVFAVPLENGEVIGRRTHLFRVGEGRLLLGSGGRHASSIALLAVGGAGTLVAEMSRAALAGIARRRDAHAPVCSMLDEWVEVLCGRMTRGAVPVDTQVLEPGVEIHSATESRVRSAERVLWVRHLEGHSLLLGRPDLKVNGTGHTPVSEVTWLQTGAGSRVRVERTAALLDTGEVWAGIDQIHSLLLTSAALDARERVAEERARLAEKARASRAALSSAFSSLAATLSATGPGPGESEIGSSPVRPAAADGDPLLAACQRVGAVMRIAVRPLPRSADAAPSRDGLAALARANRFRTRQVVLREGWWKEECGPLLAHRGEERRPVALLPARGSRYTMFDPALGEEAPVDAVLAEQIHPLASALYRPFPDKQMGITDIVRFGLSTCRRDLLMVLVIGVAGGLLSLMTPIATGMIFNDIIPGAARDQLTQLTVILLVIAVTSALFSLTSGVALVRLESKMGSAVQAGIWDRLLSLPMPFFRPYTAGNLAERAMGIDAIRQVLSGATITALLGGLFSIFHFGLLFYFSPKMAGWAALLIGIAIVATLICGKLQMRWERRVTAVRNRLAGTVLQFLSSIAKLRVSSAESQAFVIWAHQFGQQRHLQFRARAVGNVLATFQAAFPLVATLILYALALPLLTDAESGMRTGDFLAFMTSFGLCLAGMMGACGALIGAVMVIPLYEQAKPILQATPEVDTARTDPGVLTGDLEVQHLSFQYAADGPMVLRDLSLRLRAGEYAAFVGPSGSGKSTLLRMLLGFESPTTGAVYYDGRDLAGLDTQAVRRQIGVVMQNGRLMSGDLFTNIVGSSSATLEDAWEAAAMAGFDEDIRKMPMGMHTVVSEGGGTLSGGQRQRLMIARAIVQKPRILLFDEATSALDNRTQAIVSQSLDRLRATRIVIAHRLSTIINADRIYVVEAGRIVEQGSYSELMLQDRLFAELARRQLA